MWISDALDELTYDQEVDGVLVRRQLDRAVLARGAWATVMFLFEELDRTTGAYGAPRMAIMRFQKWKGGWRKHAAFNVANAAQADELAAVLARWTPRMAPEGEPAADGPDDPAPADVGVEA
jgi:hypothetical protein